MKNYPGAKNGSGVYQEIINHIPSCLLYGESHGGSYSIGKRLYKDLALNDVYTGPKMVYTDIDPDVVAKVRPTMPADVTMIDSGAHSIIKLFDLIVKLDYVSRNDVFLYSDPPYLFSTRRSMANIYKFEYTADDHIQLLSALLEIGFNCMISGYDSELYNDMLTGWRKHSFKARTRHGEATEVIWMNYNIEDFPLLNYNYIGNNFTHRQQIKRKLGNISRKINELPMREKEALKRLLNQ